MTSVQPKRKNNNNKRQKEREHITQMGRLIRSIGSMAGGALGAHFGGPAGMITGKHFGDIAGAGVSKIFGQGAYKIKQNTIYGDMCSGVPVMHSASESVVFRHREYIADVSSSSTFVTTSYSVNPGLAATFPFLAAIAQNFQEYEFRGLVFEFKSTSADALNSTNTALGTIILAAQYRADAPAFVDKQQMLNEMWATDSKPAENNLLPIECDPSENPFKVQYVRAGAITSGDIKMYDLCNLVVGSYGSQAQAVVGELWCSYDIILRKPLLTSGLSLNGETALYTATSFGSGAFLGTVASRTRVLDSIGLLISNDGTQCIYPYGTEGVFLMYIQWVGTSAAYTAPSFTYTNCTSVFSRVSPSSGVDSAKNCDVLVAINIPDPTVEASFVLSSGSLPTSIGQITFLVTQVNDSFP